MTDDAFVRSLTKAADALVPTTLREIERAELPVRGLARSLRRLLAPYLSRHSAYYRDAALVPGAREVLDRLATEQHADGTFSAGNLHSPPDSAFVVEDLAVVWSALGVADSDPVSAELARSIGALIAAAGPPLVVGGVHTPNHRWGLCAALAWIDRVAPDPAYGRRIEQWLAEGIDGDADGHYSERSPNYAARVTNPALLTLARLLGRPDLRGFVRRNLELTWWCTDPNGDVEFIASRRQDQDRRSVVLADFYPQFRELAVLDDEPRFAGAAAAIERANAVHPDVLADLLENPTLTRPMPPGAERPVTFTEIFSRSGLARLGRGGATASVFGGTDRFDPHSSTPSASAPRIGSGLATNPTFVRVSNGAAVLDGVRMITSFFGLGHFRAEELVVRDPGRFELADELAVAYYQPLPSTAVRSDGDYELQHDGRFFAKMAFAERQRDEQRLRRRVVVRTVDEGEGMTLELDVAVDGIDDVPVTLELCFRSGGSFDGVDWCGDTRVLVDGTGRYVMGEDRIEFGPGNGAGEVDPDAGEQYRVHNGHRTPVGELVYLTGRTPFRHTLRIRCSAAARARPYPA